MSDNGKTFKAASRTIDAILHHKEDHQYTTGIGVEWTFNFERAPLWSGVFERMVRMFPQRDDW